MTPCTKVMYTSFLMFWITLVLTCSKLEEEFTVREILGQGGFGVVLHVKSKLDHQSHALKLMKLPLE